MEPKSGSISRHDHARIHARMAKLETPAGFLKSDSSRVAFDGRALQFPAKGLPPGVPPADLFDVGSAGSSNGPAASGHPRSGHPSSGRGGRPGADAARTRPLADPLASAAGYGDAGARSANFAAGQGPVFAAGQGPVFAGPGPVRARERRSVDELPFVDAEDVIEEEAPVDEVEAQALD